MSRIGALQLRDAVLDEGSFRSWDTPPLKVDAGEAYRRELATASAATGLDESVVTSEGTVFGRRVALVACEFDFLAGSIGVAAAERITAAVQRAHETTFGSAPPPPNSATCSMWRDINVFNELGIPAITYGPRAERHAFRKAITVEALYQAACVYTRTMLDICNQEK